jgi:hypothetical protein
MPLIESYDDQIRFSLKSDMKAKLYREAARRRVSAADLLRTFIDEGLSRARAERSSEREARKRA